MNKKEVLEIRKQFSVANCNITRICGCYVDGEKNIKLESKDAFLSLPEEEAFKYFEIFKKTLSGSVGKNLLNMEFPLKQEQEDGTQKFLLDLRNSKLKDDMLVEEFYQKVIENYDYGQNYYIILIHCVYDIPGKATDGSEMFDASDDVYEYLLCSICPVNLSKAGLSYDTEQNVIGERMRDWIVEDPQKGFLFPVFNDRNTDIHNVLYYSKKPEELQPDFVEYVLGSEIPMTAKDQEESFQNVIVSTLGDECEYEIIKNIHENINEMLEVRKDNPEPLELTKVDVKRIFEESGVPDEKMTTFDKEYEENVGDRNTLMADNITNTRKFNIKMPDIVVSVNPERTDLVETRMIDGKPCLVITIDDHLEVNGIEVAPCNSKDRVL